MYNILIVDDHEVVLEGSKNLLSTEEKFNITIESHPIKALELMEKGIFDLCLVDINLEPLNGIKLSEKIKQSYPETAIILYTGYELSPYYSLIFEKKVDGILSKTATKEQVIQTIYAALRNEVLMSIDFIDYINSNFCYLENSELHNINSKEKFLLELVAKGYTNKAISVELKVTQRTVENYLSKIFTKLSVESRIEAVMKAKELQIINTTLNDFSSV